MTVVVRQSHATIALGSNADYAIYGDDDLVQVGADSLVAANGSALTVLVSGAGSSITIGGDGQFAPDSADDVVLFQAAGTLDVLAYSRVDTNATGVHATLAGDDTFGIYGANDIITANGLHNSIWIGQNATGAVDTVNGLTDGSLFELQGSNVAVDGTHFTATLTGDDVLSATGQSLTVTASGAANVVNISGGLMGDDNFVTFASDGIVNADNVQFLHVFGDHVTLRGPGVFSSELIGAADRAVLTGFYNNFTIGGNGKSGALDVVVGAYAPAFQKIDVVADSNVKAVVAGADVVAHGGDRVVVIGHSNSIGDSTGGNLFIVDGLNNVFALNLYDVAHLMTDDVVRMRADTKLFASVVGETAPGAATIVMGANDLLSVGPNIKVRVPVAIGQATLQFGAIDQVVLLAHFADANDLLSHTTDTSTGSIIQFDAIGDQLSVNVSKSQVGAYLAQGVIKFG